MKRTSKHPVRQVGRLLLLVLVSLTLGVNAYLWNAKYLVGDALPTPFGYGLSVVLSGSMEPALSVNDLVVIREGDTPEVGDIIVYQSGDELIIHRVIWTNGEELITQGDANSIPDDPIKKSDVKGILLTSIPFLGAVLWLMKKPVVVLLLLAAAVALMEFSYRRDQAKDSQELEEIKAEIRRLKDGGEPSQSEK